MKKCDAYYRRKLLLEKNEFPLQSEILNQHKENLTKILNEYIGKPLKVDIGLVPPLEGAKEDLLVSPSDLLIPNVRLKPPLTSKHVKAQTHAGILEIGKEIQEKYQADVLKHFDVEMKLLTDKLNFICKKETTKAVVSERLRGEKQLEMEMYRIENEFNDRLKKSLDKLYDEMINTQELKLNEQRIAMLNEMEDKIDKAIREKTDNLCNEFQTFFDNQTQKYANDLAKVIRMEEEKLSKALKNANADKLEALRLLRHDLECRNLANVMYILTAERNRCETERLEIYEEYKIIIDEMTSKSLDLYNRILGLEYICDIQQTKLQSWEDQTIRLCVEFQRFINYAFKSAPTQAEYLVNIHNFIYHHVIRNMGLQNDTKHIDNQLSNHDLSFLGKLTPSLLKLTTKEKQLFLPSRYYIDRKLTASDEHYNNIKHIESDSPSNTQILNEFTNLPSFMYNKYLYVREDFRNKKSMNESIDSYCNETSSANIVKPINEPKRQATSSIVHFHFIGLDENFSYYDPDNEYILQQYGQESSLNDSPMNKTDSVQPTTQSPSPITNDDSLQKQEVLFYKNVMHRGSILRRSIISREKGINNVGPNTTLQTTKQKTTRKILDEITYDELANISSVVDVVSDNTNKRASKLLVTRNSIIIHRSRSKQRAGDISGSKELNAVPSTLSTSDSSTISMFEPQNVIPSKLNLARDSVELTIEKSRIMSMPTLNNNKQPHKIKSKGKSLVFISEDVDQISDIMSFDMNFTNESTDNINDKSEDEKQSILNEVIMNWSEANKLDDSSTTKSQVISPTMKLAKTSRVAIITEPINVILRIPSTHAPGPPDLDDLHKLSFKQLETIDKQTIQNPQHFYYPKHFQPSTSTTLTNDRKSRNAMVSGNTNQNKNYDNFLTADEFIQARSDALKKLLSKNQQILQMRQPET